MTGVQRPHPDRGEIANAVRRHPSARVRRSGPSPAVPPAAITSAGSCPASRNDPPATPPIGPATGERLDAWCHGQLGLFDADEPALPVSGHFDADFELHLDSHEEISLIDDGIPDGPPSATDADDTVLFRRAAARYVPSK